VVLAARKRLAKSTTRISTAGRQASGIGTSGRAAASSQARRDSMAATTMTALRRPSAAAT
jgi:hypothetical protein